MQPFETATPRYPESDFRKKRLGQPLNLFLFILCLLIILPAPSAAKMVTDQLGRRVRMPDHPQRIVSMAPSITEIVFALDLSNRLVGATQFSDYPPAVKALPKVGSYVHLDVEKIVALHPDLCIAVKDGNPISVVSKLESVGIPVYAVDPINLDAVMDTLLELGRLLDVNDRAKAIVAEMADRIQRVQQRVSGASNRPAVFFQIGISPIVSVGTKTFIHELIVMAGGTNLAHGKTPYPRFSKEQVIVLRPEVIIITSMARMAVFEQVKADWQQWRELPAVKNDRIYLVDSNVLDRPTPRLVDGLELLAQLIHPDRFNAVGTGAQP
ncbi:MAG: cobalamin-binding protein [Desulfosarcina sp.]|nr:cobalamin-binding protein [Desulfosarcina sp.]MBC2745026.1 cobalamin-binding protein [Desulfosarcina sp.]MBC2767934.1 cobalamin-binding protein [Desulfosarcina sp.]